MPRGVKGSGQGGAQSNSVSRNEQEIRWRQLRDLLYPQVTTADLLRMYLEAADWDVARAHAMWNRNRDRILAGEQFDDSSSLSTLSSLSSSPSSTSSAAEDSHGADTSLSAALGQKIDMRIAMEDEGLPFNANIEQERRDAALAFRMRIESVHAVVLSISEAVLLLYLADWDTGVALAQFQSHEEARNRLRIAFDSFRGRTDDLNEQSARLAAMLDICERTDWLSVKLFLEKKRQNFIRAVISWYKSGIPPFKDDEARSTPKVRPHWGLRVDQNGRLREMPTAEECRAPSNAEAKGWAADTVDFTNPNDTNPPSPHLHSAGHGKNYNPNSTKDRAPGFILHGGKESFIRIPFKAEKERPDTIQPGPVNSSKFLLEYISKGQYKFNLFKLPKYFFSDRFEGVQDDQNDDVGADDADNDTLVDDESSTSSSSESDPSPSKTNKRKRKRDRKSTGRTAATPRKRAKTVKPCVEFDFQTPSHLADLNSWRRQNGSRIEGRVRRLPAQHWAQEELDLLYKLSQEWYEELKRLNPTTPRRELLEKGEVSSSTKADWARRMNDRFSGTFQSDTKGRPSKNARHDRKETALMTMRGRYAKLAIHFRIKMDKKWLMRLDPAEIGRFEAERDALEGEDNLLTAVAQAAADASSDDGIKVEDEVKKEEDQDEGEIRSDVAEHGDDDREE